MENAGGLRWRRRAGLVAWALILASLPAVAGPVFAPGAELFVIETRSFEIIFSEGSRSSAQRLATFADSDYDEVAAALDIAAAPGGGARRGARIPVAITPDLGTLNGYMNPFPYPHIVLYDSSLDLAWTAYRDNFRDIFRHELTHALSFGIRAPWADFLSGIFGSWVLPGLINMPVFMSEGAAVSIEGNDGVTGRANDPLVKERVRQDIRENRFKSPIEASGLFDEYPYGSIQYEYGGLFSAYIQGAYGMGKYAELWKAMGTIIVPTSLDPYEVGFYKAFRNTYGIPFVKAWADFRDSLAVAGLVDPPEVVDPESLAWLYGGLAGNQGCLFWVDLRSGRAMARDLKTGKGAPLFDAYADSISDASPDASLRGGSLLVHRSLALPDGRDRVETIAYDLAARRFLPETRVEGMREARYFRDGLVGIVSRLHYTDLVFASSRGQRVLLRGSEELVFASPAVLDEGRIALIAAVAGVRHLAVLEIDTGTLSFVRPEGADAELFAYARQLSVAEGRLLFNYNSDDRFYKLGIADFEAGELRLETTDYSGGVHWPREAGGRVYYVARFSEGDRICRYPGEPAALGARSVAFGLEPFKLEAFGPSGAESAPIGNADAPPESAESPPISGPATVTPYRPLAYANPFNMWFLYPDLQRLDRSFRIFGLFAFQDPIDTNSVTLTAGYDAKYPFADASLGWVGRALPVAIAANLGDNLAYGAVGAPERQSSASISASLILPGYPGSSGARFGLGASALARGRGESGSPYSWGYSGWNATASADLGYSGVAGGASEGSRRGFLLMSYHDLDLASLAYKTEARFAAATARPALRLDLWGAWASSPILALDSTSPVFSGDRRPPYAEYAVERTGRAGLLAEGSASIRPLDQPIHANLLSLFVNRALVDLGCRGAYFRGELLASAFARASLDLAAAAGQAAASARVFCEAYALLTEADPTAHAGLRLGLELGDGLGEWLR